MGHSTPGTDIVGWDSATAGDGCTLSWRVLDGTTRFRLWGRLDLATAPSFESALARARPHDEPSVWLDLTGLQFLAVAGVRAFLRVEATCRSDGGQLYLVRPSAEIRRLLQLTGTARLVLTG
jgi:anti-sigma B factor antagonist